MMRGAETRQTPVSVEEHRAWLLEQVEPLPVIEVPVEEALNLVLAEDTRTQHPLPLWDNSAMDGYAVRYEDIAAASAQAPVELNVTGEVAAGSFADPQLAPGEAVRIMTGAPTPAAADTVVRVEDTTGDGAAGGWADDRLLVRAAVTRGANIRRAGEDLEEGSLIARAGDHLGAFRVSALAAGGVTQVQAHRPPRVAVVVTGAELQSPAEQREGQQLRRGQISESNSLLLTGLLHEAGVTPTTVRRAPDDVALLTQTLHELAADHDLVITTGGVGPGTHDVVRIAVESEPAVRSVRVAVRPGQPQCSGRLRGGAMLCALPGNPVSAAVSFELFVRPVLRRMQGHTGLLRQTLRARATTEWRGASGRLQVVPIVISQGTEGLSCAPAVNPKGMSHAVGGHGAADGYALVPADHGDVAEGDMLEVIAVTL